MMRAAPLDMRGRTIIPIAPARVGDVTYDAAMQEAWQHGQLKAASGRTLGYTILFGSTAAGGYVGYLLAGWVAVPAGVVAALMVAIPVIFWLDI